MPIRPSGGQGIDPNTSTPDEYARARGFKNAAEAQAANWKPPQPASSGAPTGPGNIIRAVGNLPNTMFPVDPTAPIRFPGSPYGLGSEMQRVAHGIGQQMGEAGQALGQVGTGVGQGMQRLGGAIGQMAGQAQQAGQQIQRQLTPPTFGPPAPTTQPAPPTPYINMSPPKPVTMGPQQPGIGQYGAALGQFGKSLGKFG